MCYYNLRTCAYPHRDTISSLIFDPHKNQHWVECNQPKPWGRMSCGALFVNHPRSAQMPDFGFDHHRVLFDLSNIHEVHQNNSAGKPAKANQSLPVVTSASDCNASIHSDRCLFQQCEWCTTVLKVVATKAKYLQKEAEEKIGKLHQLMDDHPETKTLYQDIAQKEKELDELRHEAWKVAIAVLDSSLPSEGSNVKESSSAQETQRLEL